MDNTVILLGILIIFSFWWLDRALKNWKREQDAKMSEIKDAIDTLQAHFDDKLGTSV